jgi:hypothetical protein
MKLTHIPQAVAVLMLDGEAEGDGGVRDVGRGDGFHLEMGEKEFGPLNRISAFWDGNASDKTRASLKSWKRGHSYISLLLTRRLFPKILHHKLDALLAMDGEEQIAKVMRLVGFC